MPKMIERTKSKTKHKTKANSKPSRSNQPTEKGSPLGRRLIANLEQFVDTLAAGGMSEVEQKFTVRRMRKEAFPRPLLSGPDVFSILTGLGVSQTVFASLLGASTATVRAWEQGVNTPSGLAVRFLCEIRDDPAYWRKKIVKRARAE
jgi:DNA-binding transcriptional regulator YiaG